MPTIKGLFEKTNVKALQKKNADDTRPEPLNYMENVPKSPELLEPGANPFSIIHNIQHTMRWSLGLMQDGKGPYGTDMRIGDRYFVKSGTCSDVYSTPECKGKSRYIYINNVPSGAVPCSDDSQPVDPKSEKAPQGLLAGVIQDIVHLNPFELISSATGTGSIVSDQCELRQERVDSLLPGIPERPKYERRCTPVKKPLVCSLQSLSTSSCVQYILSDNENVKAYNTTVNDLLGSLLISKYRLSLQQIIDQKTLSTMEYTKHWMSMIQSVQTQLTQAFIDTYKNAYISVASHKHCLAGGAKYKDRGGRVWIKYTWTMIIQITFESLTNVPVQVGDVVLAKNANGQYVTGNISIINQNGTFDVNFDDDTVGKEILSSNIQLIHECQLLCTGCYNITPYRKGETYFPNDTVEVTFPDTGETYTSTLIKRLSSTNYVVEITHNGKQMQKITDISSIRAPNYILIAAEVVGNSYKHFDDEPSGYYVVGVNEPFQVNSTPVLPQQVSITEKTKTKHTSTFPHYTCLMFIFLICILVGMCIKCLFHLKNTLRNISH